MRLTSDGNFYHVEEVWDHDGTLVFKFGGVDSITDAEKLRGAEVQVPLADRIALEPGEYFHSDLIGCEVRERGSGRAGRARHAASRSMAGRRCLRSTAGGC